MTASFPSLHPAALQLQALLDHVGLTGIAMEVSTQEEPDDLLVIGTLNTIGGTGGISVSLCEVWAHTRASSLTPTGDAPLWTLSLYRHYPATRWDPGDTDTIELTSYQHLADALLGVVLLLVRDRLTDFLEAQSETALGD